MYAYSDYARLNEERRDILKRIAESGMVYGWRCRPEPPATLTALPASVSVSFKTIIRLRLRDSLTSKRDTMSTIQIKTPSPDQSLPLVKDALEMEKKLTRDSLKTTEDRITALTRELGIASVQVLEGAVTRTEENEQALLELEGELELHRTLQNTLRHLDQLEVCR
jgi:hypothetical protein